MTEPLLAITTTLRTPSEAVVRLSGECDISNVEEVAQAVHGILKAKIQRIVFDVEQLNFMGSCGLNPINQAIESLQQAGGSVVVKKPTPIVKWLLESFGSFRNSIVVE